MHYFYKIKQYLTYQEIFYWLVLAILGISGIFLIRYMTPYGLGLVNDSVGYISGARSIINGDGYSRITGDWRTVPITNYPPMFSIVIAFFGLFGLEAIRASRLLVLLCIGMNIVLIAIIIRKLTKSRLISILSTVLIFSFEPLLRIHTFALSEPLYLFFILSFLFLFMTYLDRKKWYLLALCGLISSAAFLTRYVGITLFGVAALILIVIPITFHNRLKNIGIFLGFSLPGVCWWLIRNYTLSGNAVNRQFVFHNIPDYKINDGLQNFWNWLMPDWITLFSNPSTSITTALFLLGFAFMLIFTLTNLIWGIKNPKSEKATQAYYRAMIGIHGIGYFLILIFSLMFVDSSPIFENRIIMPYVISLLICIMIIISALWQQKNKVSISIGIMIFALSCALFIPESIQTANELSQFGQGYNTYHWKVSQTIAKVKTIDEETIYSNKPNALYILANKPSYTITSPYNPATQQYRENYQKNFNTIKNRILSGDAIMVIFDYQSYLDDPQNPDHEWMIELTEGLPIIEGGDDGVIFGITD